MLRLQVEAKMAPQNKKKRWAFSKCEILGCQGKER